MSTLTSLKVCTTRVLNQLKCIWSCRGDDILRTWKRLEGGSKQGLGDETRPLLLKLVFFNFVRLVSKICVKIKYLKVPIIIHYNRSVLTQQGALVIHFRSLAPFSPDSVFSISVISRNHVFHSISQKVGKIVNHGVHTNGEMWNHVHTQFTFLITTHHMFVCKECTPTKHL